MVGRVHQGPARAEAEHARMQNHALEKTRLCRFFPLGQCSRGAACSFAHGEEQLVAQPDLYHTGLCFDYMKGYCRAGAACKFAHTTDELRPKPTQQKAQSKTAVRCERARAVVIADPASVQRQIAEVQQQAMQLQLQLAALQKVAAGAGTTTERRRRDAPSRAKMGQAVRGAAPRATAAKWSRQSSDTEDGSELASFAFSRQSTFDVASGPQAFSRQTSTASEDEWEAMSACGSVVNASVQLAHSAAELVADAGFAITVRKTFLEVEQTAATLAAAPRRARSAPAAARRAGPAR